MDIAAQPVRARVSGTPEDASHIISPEWSHEEQAQNPDTSKLEKLNAIASRLSALAQEQVGRKQDIEKEAMADLRAYYGRYDAQTEADLVENKRTRLFVNMTRSKTHGWVARLTDLLFPADDKNFGIEPTPVPELSDSAAKEAFEMQRAQSEANVMQQSGNPEAAAQAAQRAEVIGNRLAELRMQMDVAAKRAEAMETEIFDQMQEADYGVKCRRALFDGCQLGTAIMKGPTTKSKSRKKWEDKGPEGWVYSFPADERPDWHYVDFFDFFPDMTGRVPSEWGFTFQRHIMNTGRMKQHATFPGFDKEAIRRLILAGPKTSLPSYYTELCEISGRPSPSGENRYEAWEYHGPLEKSDIETICECLHGSSSPEVLKSIGFDDLTDIHAIVWFCDGEIIKIAPHPNDDGATIYSAWWLVQDNSSPFGFGVPRLIRDSQAGLNGAWRMIMENGALSARPHTIIDPQQVQQVAGQTNTWYRTTAASQPNRPAIEVVTIPNNQAALERVIMLSRQFIDDESDLPLVAQGESGGHQTQTAGGMAMLMNSANVIFRRAVKNFDDFMTVPNVQRMFDWNMEFSKKDHIKGDMKIVARGSSVLLIRELQGPNLTAIATSWTSHPTLGPWVKTRDAAAAALKASMVPPNAILRSQEEFDQQMAKQVAQPDYEMEKLKLQDAISKRDDETRRYQAEASVQVAGIRMAEARNISIEQMDNELKKVGIKVASDERKLAVEVGAQALRDQKAKEGVPIAPSGGGTI